MTQKGPHTWDMYLEYQRCPHCGYIFESRTGYEYRMGKYEKDLECLKCFQVFTIERNQKLKFGPLIGEPQPVEWDWRWQ